MQLNFKIKDDHIQLLNAAIMPINKSVNYLTAAFDFDDVWDGTRVTAVFCGRNNAPVSVLLDGITNICVIPWEALQSDVLKVSAYGIKENNGMTVRITSNTVELKLDKAGPVEGAEPATPSFTSWEQVVSRINDIEAGIVTDGSIGIAKLGDDVMQILNGKAEQSNLNETNEDIKDLEATIESINSDIIELSNSIDAKIAEAKSIIPKRYIVSELPTTDIDENGTYLVPANEPNTDNIYTEYAYINNAWEIIGNPFEVDLSGYATQNDLTQSHDSLHSEIESGLGQLSNEIYTELNTKENRISIDTVSDTEYSACFNNNVQYRLGELTSLTINLPDNISDDYISSVIFTSGATATNLIYPDTIKMLGEDCIECIFTPAANKRYEVIVSYDGVNVVGVVGGYAV